MAGPGAHVLPEEALANIIRPRLCGRCLRKVHFLRIYGEKYYRICATRVPCPTDRRATFRQRRMEGHIPHDTDPIRVTNDLLTSDRRAFARYRLRGQLRVHDRARSKRLGEATDIGLGGLGLQSTEPIPPARRYALSIEIIVDDVERPRIEVIARCAWHRARPDRLFEAGFEFVEMTPRMRRRIAEFIDEFGL